MNETLWRRDEVVRASLLTAVCVFGQMITKNFEDYPEHRLKFFSLLRAIASHCFRALFTLSNQVKSTHGAVNATVVLEVCFVSFQSDRDTIGS